MDRLATANLRSEPQTYQFLGSAELTPTHNTTISAIAILAPYRLNHLWLDVWRELEAETETGRSDQLYVISLTFSQQFSEKSPNRFSYDGTIRVIAIENPYARIPLPDRTYL